MIRQWAKLHTNHKLRKHAASRTSHSSLANVLPCAQRAHQVPHCAEPTSHFTPQNAPQRATHLRGGVGERHRGGVGEWHRRA